MRAALLRSEPSGGWLNAGSEGGGALTLVWFWAVSCGTCKHQMPSVRRWQADPSVRLVGVHTPLVESDRDPANVSATVAALGLTHPIALDTDGRIADVFGVLGLPAWFVFDDAGRLLAHEAGAGADRRLVARLAA